MSDSPEAVRKSVKLYLAVAALLFLFTVLTVAVASFEVLDFGAHGFDWVDAMIGLTIACLKASLVAYVFMHLGHEKRMVFIIIIAAAVMALFLFGLTALSEGDLPMDKFFN